MDFRGRFYMNIIYFDGVCGLCNGFVDFIMKIDKEEKFKFSPLQSEFAKYRLLPKYTEDLKSVVVEIDGEILEKSDAVFRVLESLGGKWKLAASLKIIPSFLRNAGYDLVAEMRYKIFGKKSTCRLPTPKEKDRFIL
jgi:predicted DCC family thiol-disulfide oxidoreductase YuxK